jgi:hypothetical protein
LFLERKIMPTIHSLAKTGGVLNEITPEKISRYQEKFTHVILGDEEHNESLEKVLEVFE